MGSQKKKAIKFIKKGNLKHKIAKRNEKKRFNSKKDKKSTDKPVKKPAAATVASRGGDDEGDILDDMDVDEFLNADFLDEADSGDEGDDGANDDEGADSDDDDNDGGSSSEEDDESALDPRYMSAMPADIESDDEEDGSGGAPQEGGASRRELTMEKLTSIETACAASKSVASLRPLLQIFSDACRSADAGPKAGAKKTPYDIRSSAVYNRLMVAVFTHTQAALRVYFNLPEDAIRAKGENAPSSNTPVALDAKKWTKISMTIRRFFHCCVYLIQETTSDDIHRFVLRSLTAFVQYAAPCLKTSRKLLKCFVTVWGKSLDTTVCMLAFVRIRELATIVPFPFIETCLKALYLAYMRNVKFTNGVNFQHHIVMGNCLVELYGLDLVSSYQHVFIYIRQLAMTIRKAIAAPSADALKGILTWRFVNCLKVWAAVVSAYPALKALVYPLTQLTLATIRLASIARYVPLKFQCVKVLQQIALATQTFIPTTPILLDVLQSPIVTQKKKNAVKETDIVELDLLVKLSKSALESRRVQEMVVSKVFDLLQKECDVQKYSIAFPEFGVPLHLTLSKFATTTPVPQWKRLAKGLCQQIETRSEWIRNKRMTSDIAPKDMAQIEAFLAAERKAAVVQMLEKEKKQLAEKAAQYAQSAPSSNDGDAQEGDDQGDDDEDDDSEIDEEEREVPAGSVNDPDHVEDMLHLKIQPHPPKFPFQSHPFDIVVYLVDGSENLKTGIVMALKVDLLVGDKPMSSSTKPLVTIDPSTKPIINGDGMCRLTLSIGETSMTHGNKKFQFLLTPVGSDFEVAPVMSTDMTCIRHRLMIQEDLPELWYKDEGGRDKCMPLPVHLVDATNQPVGHRAVPLRVTLLYENEHAVLKQDILKLSPDSQRVIDSTGMALLKLRIEDVSKNHQGQAFRLKVEPDTTQSPLHFDVAPDWSTPISVRSKRNKRRNGGGTLSQHHAPTSSHIDPLESPRGGGGDSHHHHIMHPSSSFDMESSSRPAKRSNSMVVPSSSPTHHHGSSSSALHPSMESILRWTTSVIHGFQQLEWQPIGYEVRLDGSQDKDRPIFRCPACWRYKDTMTMDSQQHESKCLIANVLLTYASDTVGHLDALLKLTEKYGTASSIPSPALPASTQSLGPPPLTRGITDMVNSIEVPPSLFRGSSGGLSEFMMGETGNNAAGGGGGYATSTEIAQAIERQVYCVLARTFIVESSNRAVGLPAFDRAINLLGFYEEALNGVTQINFVPMNDVPGLTTQDVNQCRHSVFAEMKVPTTTKAIFQVDMFNSLTEMKEKVFFYVWENKPQQQQQQQSSQQPPRGHWAV
ncbi:hypothetical protein DYB30_004020 [Aphanomyces astaci]|uniref:Uncharacterized protein n=2 Tax=Aphanomyces astaci TaxID=112090 RepID=A0A397E7D3_APHAT|nr:hypothetical protein DYB30_004020 [Aphanomyces astaci]